jgi:hypothetical protein
MDLCKNMIDEYYVYYYSCEYVCDLPETYEKYLKEWDEKKYEYKYQDKITIYSYKSTYVNLKIEIKTVDINSYNVKIYLEKLNDLINEYDAINTLLINAKNDIISQNEILNKAARKEKAELSRYDKFVERCEKYM